MLGEIHKVLKIQQYIFCAIIFIIVLACDHSDHSTNFGSPITNKKSIPIVTLFEDTNAYEGKTVTIRGVIDEQDQKGYWFYLLDEEARIYVEIKNADFSIPDFTSKKMLVEGLVEVKFHIPSLLATGVEHQQ